ncbi:hypothetical protein V2J09_017562 [Rumex salicifolius]
MASLAMPWMSGSSSLPLPRSSPIFPSPLPRFRVTCQSQFSSKDLKFVLHDALDSSGNDTIHARTFVDLSFVWSSFCGEASWCLFFVDYDDEQAARNGFLDQIQNLSSIERETSICVNRHVDLARTALYIASEDDSLLSHSSVPLPIESFIERMDSLSTSYFPHYRYTMKSSAEDFLSSVEKYLFVRKGFRRNTSSLQSEPKTLYLHSVLTHRCGSPVILSLIFSEVLKSLRFCGVYEFDVEIFHPRDPNALPRAYDKQKTKTSDHAHILVTESLLVEMLRDLKNKYWPFQHDRAKSLFLRAADAANLIDRPNVPRESVFELASAKAAQHRLDRGVWTSVRFGDMRCALAACERLILLETDYNEMRDYAILLYHCGFYEESLQYVKLYQETKASNLPNETEVEETNKPDGDAETLAKLEEDAVEKLIIRLNLILMEAGWSKPSPIRSFLEHHENVKSGAKSVNIKGLGVHGFGVIKE